MEFGKFENADKLTPEVQAAKDKYEALRLKLVRKLKQNPELFNNMQNEAIAFARDLEKKFPDDYLNCAAYHIFGGSGRRSKSTMADFEGEYSVINFIDRLAEKYNQE